MGFPPYLLTDQRAGEFETDINTKFMGGQTQSWLHGHTNKHIEFLVGTDTKMDKHTLFFTNIHTSFLVGTDTDMDAKTDILTNTLNPSKKGGTNNL